MGQLKLTLSDADIEALRLKAQQAGQSVSHFVRDATLGGGAQAITTEQIMDIVEDLDRRLSRIEELAHG